VVTLSEASALSVVKGIATLDFLPIKGRWGISAGGGNGYGLSYSTYHANILGGNHRLKTGLRYTTRRNSKATLGLEFNADHSNSFPIGIIYRRKPGSRYYGLGWNTQAEQLSYFTTKTLAIGSGYKRKFGNAFTLEFESIYSTIDSPIKTDDKTPTLTEVFPDPADRPYGYGKQSDGVSFSLAFKHDSQHNTGRPQSGGNQRLLASYFTSTDASDLRFWTYRAEIQQFIPLWHTRRCLALRGVFTQMQKQGNVTIPFQRLLTNDGPDLLRGFDDLRFRDTGLIIASAEYRFPVWNFHDLDGMGLDAYLFFDWGQVFSQRNEISVSHMTESHGGGFRLVTTGGFVGRLEIGQSEEGTIFRMSAEQVFQFAKGGLFDGRNPIPTR